MSARARGSLLLATLILVLPVVKAANNEPTYTTWSDYRGIGGFDAVLRPGADTTPNPQAGVEPATPVTAFCSHANDVSSTTRHETERGVKA